MDLSIITVTWNSSKHIAEQINSVIRACKNISWEHIIVDNNSNDNTKEIIGKFSSVKLIKNTSNIGFAAANNLAATLAKGTFFLFLNPDMKLKEGALDDIVLWLKNNPKVGVFSGKPLNQNGEINWSATPRHFPTILDQLAIIIKLPHIFPSVNSHYLFKNFNPELEQEVDSVQGAFMIMRREMCSQLGRAFDPRYYIWFEDVDVCREAKKLGWSVVYSPRISFVDYGGQSFNQRNIYWKQKQFTKSMLAYFQKWEPFYIWIWIALARPVGVLLAWVYSKLARQRI